MIAAIGFDEDLAVKPDVSAINNRTNFVQCNVLGEFVTHVNSDHRALRSS